MATVAWIEAAAARLVQRRSNGTGMVQMSNNLYHVGSAMALAVKDMTKSVHFKHLGYMSALSNAAYRNLYSDIRRPAESGVGSDGRRQTGNFTFGARAKGAFVGVNLTPEGKNGSVQGFGYPDVDRADEATQGVWRALEMGLSGTAHMPSFYSEDMGRYAPTGSHVMPPKYEFSSPDPSSAYLYLGGKRKRKTRAGAGFEGKHFIELAWREVTANVEGDYENIARIAFGAFK